jgi:hypothetical protein
MRKMVLALLPLLFMCVGCNNQAIVAPAADPGYEGFSYYSNGQTVGTGFSKVILDAKEYDTFQSGEYDSSQSRFTASKSGYYRFYSGGYSTSYSASPEGQVKIGFRVNGTLNAVGGGLLSSSQDSSFPMFVKVLHLEKGDYVEAVIYTSVSISIGSSSAGHKYWFQGEYIGE